MRERTFGVRAVTALLMMFASLASPDVSAQPARVNARLIKALAAAGGPLQDAYYACLLNGLAQGLPLAQIRRDCALQTIDLASRGFGDTQLPGAPDTSPVRVKPAPFDPASLTASCNAGDPAIAGGRQTNSVEPVQYRGSDAVKQSDRVPGNRKDIGGITIGDAGTVLEGYDYGTYGGRGKTDPDDKQVYQGLSKEDSMDKKAEWILAADDLLKKYMEARDAIAKETDGARIVQAIEKARAAYKAWQEAHDQASADPNKVLNSNRTANGVTPCEQSLQEAREFLYQCHMSEWRSAECAALRASLNNCPDPKQIYVDPESGYACGRSIDAEALKNAWVARCEQLKRFGPGGDNPCAPPSMSPDGRFAQATPDLCASSPDTYIDPGSDSCVVVVEVKPFGQPDLQKIYVWGLNNLGGPVVVLAGKDPQPPPRPRVGPDPRPPR